MTTLRAEYREIRRKLSSAALNLSVLAARYAASERRAALSRIPNGPPARAERREAITRKHKGEV